MGHISADMNGPLLELPGGYEASVLDGDGDGLSDAMVLRVEGRDGHEYGVVAVSKNDAQPDTPKGDTWGEGTLFVVTDRTTNTVLGMYCIDAQGNAVPQDYLDHGQTHHSKPLQTERSDWYGDQVAASTFALPDGTQLVMKTVDRQGYGPALNGTQLTVAQPAGRGLPRGQISFFSEGLMYDEDRVYPATFSVEEARGQESRSGYSYAFFEAKADTAWPQSFPQEQLHPAPPEAPAKEESPVDFADFFLRILD